LCPSLCGHGIERGGENAEVESLLLGEEVEGVEWAGGVKELEAREEDDAYFSRKEVSGHVGDGSDLFAGGILIGGSGKSISCLVVLGVGQLVVDVENDWRTPESHICCQRHTTLRDTAYTRMRAGH
jgi:hypothetical protein